MRRLKWITAGAIGLLIVSLFAQLSLMTGAEAPEAGDMAKQEAAGPRAKAMSPRKADEGGADEDRWDDDSALEGEVAADPAPAAEPPPPPMDAPMAAPAPTQAAAPSGSPGWAAKERGATERRRQRAQRDVGELDGLLGGVDGAALDLEDAEVDGNRRVPVTGTALAPSPDEPLEVADALGGLVGAGEGGGGPAGHLGLALGAVGSGEVADKLRADMSGGKTSKGKKAAIKNGIAEKTVLSQLGRGKPAGGELNLAEGRYSVRKAPRTPRARIARPPLQPGMQPVQPYDPNAGEPARFLPQMAYFENTYLGGNAAHREELRRLDGRLDPGAHSPWRAARLPPQPLDEPEDAGLSLTATLDRPYLDSPGRVLLQVGLRGSSRAGWRRPPLDTVLVIDRPALADSAAVVRTAGAILGRLGPADRLAVIRVGESEPVLALSDPDTARRALLRDPETLLGPVPGRGASAISRALGLAAAQLDPAASRARIPGTGVVLFLAGGADDRRMQAARRGAHRLTLTGATVSVLELVEHHLSPRSDWWRVAHAGHGGHHRLSRSGPGADADAIVTAELDRLAQVVARLVRLNVRLAPGVRAVRVLGSRLLAAEEVVRVKAREKAVDDQISRTMGVSADRGDDDDGLQTVIPYFLGGDTHVVLIELWVTEPGPIADVSLRFKDMVRLDNGRAEAGVALGALPRSPTRLHTMVRENAWGVAFAEALGNAARAPSAGGAVAWLDYADSMAVDRRDRGLVSALRRLRRASAPDQVVAAIEVTARRRLGVGWHAANR